MKLHILIGGKAGQGINKISGIISKILAKQGYFIFNYQDYPSVIRGGNKFNIVAISDNRIGSIESRIDGIIALNPETVEIHKRLLKTPGFIIDIRKFEKDNLGININVALAAALIKVLGFSKETLIKEIDSEFKDKQAVNAANIGYESEEQRFKLKKINREIKSLSGSRAIAQGALNSKIDFYFSYPMTPATGVMEELAITQINSKNNLVVFQPENEIAAVNASLGASFAGARTMTGTSGGGFDLMTEALSFQGQSEIPLVIYLASRSGPGTGVPTYTSQADLDVALRAGHGEFPRIVIAPGDPIEAIEKTNEAFYLSEKFSSLAIILSDKHLAESEFSSDRKPNKILNLPAKKSMFKASSYEHDNFGNTTESAEITKKNAERRIAKYDAIKKECKKFEMIKLYGKKDSKNLIIAWGSTKTAILDAIEGLDCKFLQVLYLKPMSGRIKEEIIKAKKVILIENNSTGQLGRLIREKTGIKIKNRILKYDSLPFKSDELKKEIMEIK